MAQAEVVVVRRLVTWVVVALVAVAVVGGVAAMVRMGWTTVLVTVLPAAASAGWALVLVVPAVVRDW